MEAGFPGMFVLQSPEGAETWIWSDRCMAGWWTILAYEDVLGHAKQTTHYLYEPEQFYARSRRLPRAGGGEKT